MKIYKVIFSSFLFCAFRIVSASSWSPPTMYMGYHAVALKGENVAVYHSDVTGQDLEVSIVQTGEQYFLKREFKDDMVTHVSGEILVSGEDLLLKSWLDYKKQLKEEFDDCGAPLNE